MVEFETVKATEVPFGSNNFIEISKRKAVTPVGEIEFYAISRGYYLPDGTKRWKGSIALPQEKEKRKEIAKYLNTI